MTEVKGLPSIEETQEMLNNQRKYLIRIKQEANNPNYKTERVIINGLCIQIPVGEEVEVPELVKNLLINKGVI